MKPVVLSILAIGALSGVLPAGEAIPDPREGFLGVLLPQVEVGLAPLVEGRLQRLHVRIGDRIREGALLAEIDEQPIRQEQETAAGRLEEARGAESEAVTRLTMAREALARLRALAEEDIVSAEELSEAERQEELAESALKRARGRIQQEEASMNQLDAKRANARLLSPFAGRVAETYAAPGTTVEPGRPIVRLISDGSLWARFAVPVEEARGLKVDSAIRVRIPDAGVELAGAIKQVGPAVDQASGMVIYEAVVEMPENWDGPPLAGQTVRVRPGNTAP